MTAPDVRLAEPFDGMTDDDLLRLLETEEDRLPREAVDEFVARADRMIEPLTAICCNGKAWQTDGNAFWTAVHATFIVAAIGGERSVPGLLGALRHGHDRHVEWVTEVLPAMFGAVGAPAVEGLMRVVTDEKMSGMARWSAATCLGGVAARHDEQRDRVLDFLRDVTGHGDDYEVRGGAGMVLLDFRRPGDRDTLERLGQQMDEEEGGLRMFVASDVDHLYQSGKAELEVYLQDWLSFYDAHEIADRQERWQKAEVVREAEDRQPRVRDDSGLLLKAPFSPGVQARNGVGQDAAFFSRSTPASPPAPKTGRNDPCPCGSGKKFKKCHGAK